jgi:cation diffusion facilitator family transporter
VTAGSEVGEGNESLVTVLVAGAANLGIAAAKAVAGALSGSSAMLSEAAHSVGDTVNEVLLVVALRRGAHPADRSHPFGYGQESFFWALLAAFATFVLGAGFSITHGLHTISHGQIEDDFGLSYIVLAVAFVLESVSLRRSLTQLRRAADRWDVDPAAYLRRTPDTALKAVVLEDVAALAGLLIAAAGLGLEEVTGSVFWDGAASVLIGLLLLVVAGKLARDNVSLLTGEAAPARFEEALRDEIDAQPGIDGIVELRTMMLGPDRVLVAAAVDYSAAGSSDEVEATATAVQEALSRRFPEVRHVFLDPTSGTEAGS